jgi:tetratricopeptide (TPR) repeat protein
MFTWLKSLLSKSHTKQTDEAANANYLKGLKEFDLAKEKYLNKNYEDALPLFDAAASNGITAAYEQRAFCLQALEYHLDALSDFEQAIELNPEDCNLYFASCWSRLAVGQKEEAVSGIDKAIALSKLNNALNATHSAYAKSEGYSDIHHMMLAKREGILLIARMSIPVNPKKLIRRPGKA